MMAAAEVMVVDDTPANLTVLGDLLRAAGYAVRPVPDGRMAVAAAQAAPPDLVLLDIRMPAMDGFAVCGELARDPRNADLPVIFLSASDDPEDKVRAFARGGVDYVTKPFNHDEVLARVRTHLHLRGLQRELAGNAQRLEMEVRRRTEQLAAAHARLERVDRTRAEFLACLAHVLRTPANGVIGVGELLLRGHDRDRLAPHFARARADLLALIEQAQAMATVADLAGFGEGAVVAAGAVIDAALARQPATVVEVDADCDRTVRLPGDRRVLVEVMAAVLATAARLTPQPARLAVASTGDRVEVRIVAPGATVTDAAIEALFDWRRTVLAEHASVQLRPLLARRLTELLGGTLAATRTADGLRFTLGFPGGSGS